MWGKHMYTGYRDPATTTDTRVSDLERRLAELERELTRRDHETEMRRMWLSYYAYSALLAVGIAVIVYLAGSLH